MIQIKRIYDPFNKADGLRVLVDRLWPRGIKKESAHVDLWTKDLAPSVPLRKWFNHEPEKFKIFKQNYLHELGKSEAITPFLEEIESHHTVTLLYGAKDKIHNHAIVLRDFLSHLATNA
ncbi:DUF488 domain-containing protein [Pedobacter nyackensis]|uniref:DUF488 domain-containing protein n=1 Tax=Pedobacter nyackensis TaxID=475255 RepID=UPI0029309B85|nr:DUF488 domain-containing protein [Pedobacter nyackensis]